MKKKISIVSVLALCMVAEVAKADFTFGEPSNLGSTVNSSANDDVATIATDDLSLYFCSVRSGGYGNYDLWVTTRPTTDDPWGTPTNLGPIVNSSSYELHPDISADGLSLYFSAWSGNRYDICVTERTGKDQPWGTPIKLGPNVNHATYQFSPDISPDGMRLYFESSDTLGGASDIWTSIRQTPSDVWEPAIKLGDPVNTPYHDSGPHVSNDGLALFFHSDRPGGYGSSDLYIATRPTVDSNWRNPVNLGPMINTIYGESDPYVSADGRMLYFSDWPEPRPGGQGGEDLWQAPIIPIVDFDGDGIVDTADMCILIDRWGENYSLCDIGPTPLGDGIVDFRDLVVL
ncbi:MAG: TolB family protein, partial [Planctomycetota bacterium]